MKYQPKNTAKKKYEDTTHIHFTSEKNAQLWLIFCLEREKIISEFKTEFNRNTLYFDIVLIENARKRMGTLTVLELKKDVVTKEHVIAKFLKGYPEAIVKQFGMPKDYELTFVGSSIEADAEYLMDDLLIENKLYPTKSGVLKPLVVNFKTYEQILEEYYKRWNVTNLQAKNIRNMYGMLSGHRDRLPWIG